MPDEMKDDGSSVVSSSKKHSSSEPTNESPESKKAKLTPKEKKNDDNNESNENKLNNENIKARRGNSVDSCSSSNGSGFSYDPVHFIRCHSKNNDPADIQTQIWEVAFEPDSEDASKTTTKVATCGGNAICIIDVLSGMVLMKYKHKEFKEQFFTLAWTTLELESERSNILVSGGMRGEIRMFHPKRKLCFHEWRPSDKKAAVNTLVFHSEQPTWLFCGSDDGLVTLWDIGVPRLPSYEGVKPVCLLKLNPDYGQVCNIAWTGANGWLLAGTGAGLIGWKINVDKVKRLKDYKPQLVDFLQPENKADKGENPFVDSLTIVSEWTVASKCGLHGFIYVWDLKSTCEEIEKDFPLDDDGDHKRAKAPIIEQEVTLLAKMRWSDTDNLYMNIGSHKGRGVICCGDDRGCLWVYNQPSLLRRAEENGGSSKPVCSPSIVEPSVRLTWPELQDDDLENSRKVPLEKSDIIVNKVAVSHDANFIVAVTSNNMVCIWKRAKDDDTHSSSSTSSSELC